MFFHCIVSSKDNYVLKKFLRFLLRLEVSPVVLKSFPKQKKRKFITILKSPHVNKTAQEQFEFRFYSKEFRVNSSKPLTFFLMLKKVKNISFPGVKLEVKGLVNLNQRSKSLLTTVNPDNITFIEKPIDVREIILLPKRYIQLFDSYGEYFLRDTLQLTGKTFK